MTIDSLARNHEEFQPLILYFPKGILGLESYNKFLYRPVEEYDNFFLLQALDEPSLELLTVVPFLFFPDYAFDLTEKDKKELNIERVGELTCHTIVNQVKEDLYTNLAAPILINPARHRGKQIILPERFEEIRTRLIVP